MVKNLPAMQGTQLLPLGQEDPPEKGIATHSDILAWRISRTRDLGGLQSHRVTKSQTQLNDFHFFCFQSYLVHISMCLVGGGVRDEPHNLAVGDLL